MASFSQIFSSKAQAALIGYLLKNRGKFYNQVALASALGVSSSTIARLIENLANLDIVKYERFDGGVKVIVLNDESSLTKTLINFYSQIKEIE